MKQQLVGVSNLSDIQEPNCREEVNTKSSNIENDIYIEETINEKGDFIKLKRPPGRPPRHLIPKIIYWIYIIIGTVILTITTNFMLLMGVVGSIGGYYIGHSFELTFIGLIIGLVIGYIFFEGK